MVYHNGVEFFKNVFGERSDFYDMNSTALAVMTFLEDRGSDSLR